MVRLNLAALLLQPSWLLAPVLVMGDNSAKPFIVFFDPYVMGASYGGLRRREDIVLQSLTAASVSEPTKALMYMYTSIGNGYSAVMTDAQANHLRSQPGVFSVKEDAIKYLHTTYTPRYLGVDQDLAASGALDARGVQTSAYGEAAKPPTVEPSPEHDIIVGVLDTGAWPESPSYDDAGMPPRPSKWKGTCEAGPSWPETSCNNKLIGARVYFKGLEAMVAANNQTYDFDANHEYKSPRDADGHGTHTSTTVAGSSVANVGLYGLAMGTARGVAIGARLAIYKVCWFEAGCANSDILAAIDDAVKDGVDVVSMSIGGPPRLGGDTDPISTGAFGAFEKGVLFSASAGNQGPVMGTVENNAPWMMTVGANSVDREFPAFARLGSAGGTKIAGTSLYTDKSVPGVGISATEKQLPLIWSSSVPAPGLKNKTEATLCAPDSLNHHKVAGKIVICMRGTYLRVAKGATVRDAGGLGMILVNDLDNREATNADAHVLPAIHVGHSARDILTHYISKADGKATASLDFAGTRFGGPSPKMAFFSSRGPNLPVPDILKPDVTAPGIDILAAYNGRSPTNLPFDLDKRKVAYTMISGTSMSCPHGAGVAAFVLARNPTWTPAMVKSAIMTTAYTHLRSDSTKPFLDPGSNTSYADSFAFGNGHVDPVAALHPGLVYDSTPQDHIDFLCANKFTKKQIREITRNDLACDPHKKYSLYDLNYPSFAVWYDTNVTTGVKTVTFRRNVTNVGGPATYTSKSVLADPSKVSVDISPETLTFKATGESALYTVKMKLYDPKLRNNSSFELSTGRLEWSDGRHTVSSSMGFFWGQVDRDSIFNPRPGSSLMT